MRDYGVNRLTIGVQSRNDEVLTIRNRPLSAAAETYRYLRDHLSSLIASVPDGGAVVLVTAAQAGDEFPHHDGGA